TIRVLDDVAAHRSQQEAREVSSPASAHDDEAGILGRLDNGALGSAGNNDEFHGQLWVLLAYRTRRVLSNARGFPLARVTFVNRLIHLLGPHARFATHSDAAGVLRHEPRGTCWRAVDDDNLQGRAGF